MSRVMVQRSSRARSRTAGFTLLELLTVLGVISVLLGVGVGFLQRGSTDRDVALGIVRGELRAAANSARASGLPAEVLVVPGDELSPPAMQARVLRHVGTWHLEPDERWAAEVLRPQLTGVDEPRGRFGHGMRPDPDGTNPMLAVAPARSSLFALEQGFALRLDVKLEARGEMGLARMARALELKVDADDRVVGQVTLADPGPRPGLLAAVRSRRPVPLDRWVVIELVHDGREVTLRIDGREEGRAAARGEVFRQQSDVFEVSVAGAPILGVVDEVQLLAYDLSELQRFPLGVELQGFPDSLVFSGRGVPESDVAFGLRALDTVSRWQVAPGGVLRPLGTESAP